jgi:large subunit ribosomal protein L21
MSWLTKVRSLFSKNEEVKEDNNQDLSSMKLSELRAVAKERGMKGYTSLRKAQLLDRLQGD